MLKKSALAVLWVLSLAACGGGGSAGSSASAAQSAEAQTEAQSNDTAAADKAAQPRMNDCFRLTPGVTYTYARGEMPRVSAFDSTYKIIEEEFNGKTSIGKLELRADGTRFGTLYFEFREGEYFQFLGVRDFDQLGHFSSDRVLSDGARIPLNMMPGQTVVYQYTVKETARALDLQTSQPRPLASPEVVKESLTFDGFENITLGGHQFKNACKITSRVLEGGDQGERDRIGVSWVAEGFGIILSEELDADGKVAAKSREELVSILAAP